MSRLFMLLLLLFFLWLCLQEHAFESSQKYKEGKYIIEMAHMIKENGWESPPKKWVLYCRAYRVSRITFLFSFGFSHTLSILSRFSCFLFVSLSILISLSLSLFSSHYLSLSPADFKTHFYGFPGKIFVVDILPPVNFFYTTVILLDFRMSR